MRGYFKKKNKGSAIRILLIEDSPIDALMIKERLHSIDDFDIRFDHESTLSAGISKLVGGGYDLVLLDLFLDDSSGLDTLRRLREVVFDITIIVLSRAEDNETGIEAVKAGAQDYLQKDTITNELLSRSIRYSLERHRFQRELRIKEEKYKALLESTPDIVWEVTLDGTITYCSPQIREIFDVEPDFMVGRKAAEFLPRANRDDILQKIDRAVSMKEPIRAVEVQLSTDSGKEVILETRGVPFFEENGRFFGYRGVTMDITDRKQTETLQAQLKAEKMVVERLQDIKRMKSQMIVTVTHELRTPMTPLRSAVEMLLDETTGEVNDGQRELLEMMQRNIIRLARFATDVLTLSRIQGPGFKIQPRKARLAVVLKSVLDLLQHKAFDAGMTMERVIPEDLDVFADPDALNLVVSNLVDNAISHNPEGTRVRISAARAGNGLVSIEVLDNGKGIPEKLLPRIWESFYQAEREVGPGYRGTGLGLSVCKELVERMHGNIGVKSEVDRGTSFKITLPSLRMSENLLFGRLAVEKGLITMSQLQEALNQRAGEPGTMRIGDALISMRYMTTSQRDAVIEEQMRIKGLDESYADEEPEKDIPKIGDIAVKQGFITRSQLMACLMAQERLSQTGEQPRFGEVLVRLKYVDRDKVLKLLKEQGIAVVGCSTCARRYNVPVLAGNGWGKCPVCGHDLVPVDEIDVKGDIEPQGQG